VKSILIKDYLENKVYFLIMIAAAIISLALAAWLKQLDPGIALVLLFMLQGPPLIILISQNQISSEVKKNTLPFLNSLPLSPFKLWLAKLCFPVLFAVALYTVYIVLSLICGVKADDLYQMFIKYPAIGIGIPALALCFGFYNTMLPPEYIALSFLILLPPGAWIASNLNTLLSINYNLFNSLLCIMFLTTSAAVFLNDRNQNNDWRGVRGIAMLIVGILTFIGIWIALDKSVDKFPLKPGGEPAIAYLRPANNGNSVIVSTITNRSSLDVITPRHSYYTLKKGLPAVTSIDRLFKADGEETSHVLMINLKDGSLKQIGNRNSYFQNNEINASRNSGNGFSQVLLSQTTLGFFRGYKSAIIDPEGNIAALLPGDGTDYNNSDDFFKIDDQRFIYCETLKNGQSELTDYVLYEKGKGLKTIHTSQSDFGFSQFISVPSNEAGKPDRAYIVGASDSHPGNLVLISVPDGKLKTFPVSPSGSIQISSSNLMVYRSLRPRTGNEPRKYDMNLVYFDGSVKQLADFPEGGKLIAVSPENKLLVLIPQPSEDTYTSYWKSLIEMDHENGTSREIIRFEKPVWQRNYISRDQKKVLLYTDHRDTSNENIFSNTYSVDTATGEAREIENLRNQRSAGYNGNVFATNESKFIIRSNKELFELDLETGSSKTIISLNELESRLQKGGAAK